MDAAAHVVFLAAVSLGLVGRSAGHVSVLAAARGTFPANRDPPTVFEQSVRQAVQAMGPQVLQGYASPQDALRERRGRAGPRETPGAHGLPARPARRHDQGIQEAPAVTAPAGREPLSAGPDECASCVPVRPRRAPTPPRTRARPRSGGTVRRLPGVPRVIVLNGPPGCGKSTLAQRYVGEHPLALNLDIDRVRDMIGGWRDDPHTAGLLARAITLAAAGAHLAGGHDVVIPQYLGRPAFLEQVEQLASDVGAEFCELVLMDTRDNALRRFADRTQAAADPAHVQAGQLLDRHGGTAELAAMYDRLTALVATRPSANIVHTHAGQVDRAYHDFLAALS